MHTLNYGIVGNCKSAALVSETGSIDWLCLPNFNSPSVFAKILDKNKGGSFEIQVNDSFKVSQKYLKKTNILVTNFKSGEDIFEIHDFMPRYQTDGSDIYAPSDLVRYIKHISGKPKCSVLYNPMLEYAEFETQTEIKEEYIKSFTIMGAYDSLYLYTNYDKQSIIDGSTIEITEDGYFVISYNQKILTQNVEREFLKLQRTMVYWLNFSEKTRVGTNYDEQLIRSALVLKLLSFDKTGAVLAAATTSLPETIGEVRNWDYRFCWLRDASMVIKVMSDLGHTGTSKRFMNYIINLISDKDEEIQIMYGINGEKKLTEHILDHLEGYEKSAPVRIGNAAYEQKQHDIYGILLDVIYQQFIRFEDNLVNSEDLWTITRSVVRAVIYNWRNADRGIWEIRTDQKHFTFSKVLCWVAIDRGIKIAELLRKTEYVDKWDIHRKEIKEDILSNAWNEDLNAFTQSYGSQELDASTLLMESYGFIDAKDPKYISTVKQTYKNLSKNGLMYRYKNKDDFGLPSSSFTICTFWMIQSLYKIGQKTLAKNMFSKLLDLSNHVNLYSEDIDFETKRLLGNFPQAYSHLALIETAFILSNDSIVEDNELLEVISTQ